jgi:hypothetical protein
MAREVHPAVRAVHQAALTVLHHGEPQGPVSLWRRLFSPKDRRLYDKVRQFSHTLNNLLDIPPMALSPSDIATIGTEVEQVVQRAEEEVDRNDPSSDEPLDAFARTIYEIRARYEQIYRRGGTGA